MGNSRASIGRGSSSRDSAERFLHLMREDRVWGCSPCVGAPTKNGGRVGGKCSTGHMLDRAHSVCIATDATEVPHTQRRESLSSWLCRVQTVSPPLSPTSSSCQGPASRLRDQFAFLSWQVLPHYGSQLPLMASFRHVLRSTGPPILSAASFECCPPRRPCASNGSNSRGVVSSLEAGPGKK